MKPRHFMLCMLLLILCSCVTIVKWKYGIKNPREETPEKLMSFLEKHQYPDSCMFMFGDTLSYFRCMRNPVFRKNLLSHMIFDSNGSLLLHDTAKCQWSGFGIIKALNPDSAYLMQKGLQLRDILNSVCPIGIFSGPDTTLRHPDFTVVVTWAKFLGKYNARLFELSDAIEQNTSARIRLIWLNIDMQKSWNLTKEQKMAIR
jgi:hypothetical protein